MNRIDFQSLRRLARGALGAVAIGLAVFTLPAATHAQGLVHEFSAGVLYHDAPGLWSGFSVETTAPDINLEVILEPSLRVLGGELRPAFGGTINTGGGTSHAYLDARWQIECPSGIFFGVGLGAAVHNGQLTVQDWDKKALGSRVLFHIPIEAGVRLDNHNSVSVYFEHTSNANTASPNEGLDRIGLRYGYRF
jgi:lipid A 3-O-deacylase